jgi:hypothetical protein
MSSCTSNPSQGEGEITFGQELLSERSPKRLILNPDHRTGHIERIVLTRLRNGFAVEGIVGVSTQALKRWPDPDANLRTLSS